MSELVRFGISMDSRLLQSFDQMIAEQGYSNRSEAIRDLVRDRLVDATWKEEKKEVVGTITLVYDHEIRELNDRLIEIQHQFHDRIVSSLHVHLDQHNCLEVLVVKGKGKDVRRIGERLIGVKGVKHGKLLTTTTGKEIF
ncbi:MAG: nickel-responsive transcriptional regulator NikR [Proteobacteria bacterium]|nr:nickel-responsive transcriptional regulator NikR [Pseudomonadota bacterium]